MNRPRTIMITLLAGILASSCARRDGAITCTQPSPTDARSAAPIATQGSTPAPAILPPTVSDLAAGDFPGLPNVVAYHEGYYSGAAPEGAAGFDTLASWGIKTIVSVDGAEPELEAAHARGMRYIHLPISYAGFDEQRKLELVRACRDALAEGPVYVHCHHGKHRSAGAAATVAASLGWATPAAMVERMKVSGTSPSYKGLYECAAGANVLASSTIDAIPPRFPEVSRPVGFVKAMVEIDEATENLKAIQNAGWVAPAEHPGLSPASEAGRLADLLRLVAHGDRAQAQPEDFAARLRHNAEQAGALEAMLSGGETGPKVTEQFKLVGASCKDCHAKYRD